MNGLMLAFSFSLPYHVLRTAAAAGVRVHILGNGESHGLRMSRSCGSYRRSEAKGNGEFDPDIVTGELREIVDRHGIEVIFPSDDVSTRLLTLIRDRLPVRTSLLPGTATFDLLNDKWNFCRFARDNGVRVPETWLYDSVADIERDVASGALTLPLTVKPTNRSGGVGVIHVHEPRQLAELGAVFYSPILVQRYIAGKTIGISVMCRGGEIFMHATQWYDDRTFALFSQPDLLENAARVVAAAGLDGPAFFDAILEEATGLSHIVECNPRFWFSIYMPAFLGLNFVEAAFDDKAGRPLEPLTLANANIRRRPPRGLLHLWHANPQDRRYLTYQLTDPLGYLLQRFKVFDDRDAAPEPKLTSVHRPAAAKTSVTARSCWIA